tara:strand:- start:247 stop:408 length:162 start_codon:yes stop_codon:yes gene_type:complete
MPIWLRKFTFNEIKTQIDKENEEYNKANNKSSTVNFPTGFNKHLSGKGSYKKG